MSRTIFSKTKQCFLGLCANALCLITFLTTPSTAQSTRVTSLEELKSLEAKIQEVAQKAQPAIVALTSMRTGSTGSGVIVAESGLILTAAHVVQGNREMDVILLDGRAFKGKVLGANRTKDIAMVQLLKEEQWPYVPLGDSAAMKVGDYVVAMGHAGGYDPKRHPPIRFGRLLSKNYNGFITTDCTLIGGDSGGPLFDTEGNLIGINSSIGNILANNNHAGITELIADWEKLERGETWGRLALNPNPLADPNSPVMGFMFKELPNRKGVLINGTVKNSPAMKAGLKSGDIVLAVDNEKINRGRDLLVAMAGYRPGDQVNVTVLRNDKIFRVKMKLARRADFSRQ